MRIVGHLAAALLVVAVSVGCSPTAASVDRGPGRVAAPAVYDLDERAGWPERLDIPLARSGGYLLIPAYVDGRSAGLMMIDTGATISVVAQGLAGTLGLPADGRGRTVGVGGFEDFDYRTAEAFSIGGDGVAVPSGRRGALRGTLGLGPRRFASLNLLGFGRSLGVGLAGIVGFTDLAPVPFTLDAAAQTLTVHRPDAFRPAAGATRHRLHRYRRLPMVRAELDDGRQRVEVWLIVDYGADTALTLPTEVVDRFPGVVSVGASGAGRTRGVGGTVESRQTWVRRFRLFGLDLRDVPVNFETPPPTMRGDRLIGRVGNGLLQHFRLTFHASHGYVYAEWTPGTPENDAAVEP
ncbi:MAG: aspartyl protease family protein [Planctomycetota bacterium]